MPMKFDPIWSIRRISVGSLMDPGVFTLPEDLTVEEAMAQVRSRAPERYP